MSGVFDDIARGAGKGKGALDDLAEASKAALKADAANAAKATSEGITDAASRKGTIRALEDFVKTDAIQNLFKKMPADGSSVKISDDILEGATMNMNGITLKSGDVIGMSRKGEVIGFGSSGGKFWKKGGEGVDISRFDMTNDDLARFLDTPVAEVAAKRGELLDFLTKNPKFVLGSLTVTGILILSIIRGQSPLKVAVDEVKTPAKDAAKGFADIIAEFFNSLGITDFFKSFGLYISIGCACILFIYIFSMLM